MSVDRDADEPWTLSLRVPEWAKGAALRVWSGGAVVETVSVAPGRADVTRAFRAGDDATPMFMTGVRF